MPAVSVIIPVYNVEKYLEECLQSVIGQTLSDLEIICVDDGSDDGSIDILHKFVRCDGRIKLIELKENHGQSYARNRGSEAAEGQYIYYLDADDSIEGDAMETLFKEAVQKDLDVIFFDASLQYESEALAAKFASYKVHRIGGYQGVKTGLSLFGEFMDRDEWSVSTPRQFWSREFLIKNHLKFYEGIIHEDELFSFQATALAARAEYMNRRFFRRRFRKDSTMTTSPSARNFYGYFTAAYYMNQFMVEHDIVQAQSREYLAKLVGKAERLYEMLWRQGDISAKSLGSKELIAAYCLFEAQYHSCVRYGNISARTLDWLKGFRDIYIYGAGAVGEAVCKILSRESMIIKGFLVSEAKGNPAVLMGRSVSSIDECELDRENEAVVVAVSDVYQQKVIERIKQTGLSYILYNA